MKQFALALTASAASSAEMRRILRQQQAGARRIPHFLDVPVGHKTGDFPPVLANDVGIVYARSGPIVVSIFANAIRGPYAEAEDRIGPYRGAHRGLFRRAGTLQGRREGPTAKRWTFVGRTFSHARGALEVLDAFGADLKVRPTCPRAKS